MTDDSEPSDEALLERWRAGDKQAAEMLLLRHFVGLRSFFISRLHDEDIVKDLVQDTLLAAVEKRDRFPAGVPVRAYLFGIARNKYRKELKRRAEAPELLDPEKHSLADVTGRSHSSIVTDKDELRRLFDALRRISIKDQDLLELHYFQDLTAEDLGVLERISTNTAKSRLRLAREKLGRRLNELAGVPPDRKIDDEKIEKWMREARASARRGELRPPDETGDRA